jgi:hypothetical protein
MKQRLLSTPDSSNCGDNVEAIETVKWLTEKVKH